ncbi:hypothetical protein [Shinella sp.]|uniref:hypothetical protein n=1 Tax=Shinella sp. TaxID=1870904 RepID=UPI003F722FDB
MTTLITSPRKPMSDASAQSDCENAVARPVCELIDKITQAGWAPEIAYAAVKRVLEDQTHACAKHPRPAEGRKPSPFPLAPF